MRVAYLIHFLDIREAKKAVLHFNPHITLLNRVEISNNRAFEQWVKVLDEVIPTLQGITLFPTGKDVFGDSDNPIPVVKYANDAGLDKNLHNILCDTLPNEGLVLGRPEFSREFFQAHISFWDKWNPVFINSLSLMTCNPDYTDNIHVKDFFLAR